MTDGDDERPAVDSEGTPVDFERLSVIADRLSTSDRFAGVDEQPSFAPDRVVCTYDRRFYPGSVEAGTLDITWFENGGFSIHYHEDHPDGAFDHRWDRHPSDHNTRDHIHPGPDAPTPGNDVSHPDDWRDVLSMVLDETETRQRRFWTE